jgi:hypothetical protein
VLGTGKACVAGGAWADPVERIGRCGCGHPYGGLVLGGGYEQECNESQGLCRGANVKSSRAINSREEQE